MCGFLARRVYIDTKQASKWGKRAKADGAWVDGGESQAQKLLAIGKRERLHAGFNLIYGTSASKGIEHFTLNKRHLRGTTGGKEVN